MHYIIFGAGADGKLAMNCLYTERCAFFFDTNKAGEVIQGRRVLNYEQLKERYDTGHYIIVIASSKYQTEMELFLKAKNMQRYFIFNYAIHRELNLYKPAYILYGEAVRIPFSVAIMYHNVQRYSHIAISSINPALPYIISEVAIQCQRWSIDYIVDESVEPGVVTSYMGIPCRHLSEIEDNIDCLLITASCINSGIRDLIPECPSYDVVDCFDIMKFVPEYQHPELKRFKDKHLGERCFIVGNGPSLRMADLDLLQQHGEITFGVNEIFKAFTQTKWRPSYYCTVDLDGRYFPEYDIYHYVSRDECVAFYGDPIHWDRGAREKLKDRYCIHTEQFGYLSKDNMPPFSSDICSGVWVGNTVVYCCMQIAAYMGFKEIYVIGIDGTNYEKVNEDNYCISNYLGEKMINDNYFDLTWNPSPDLNSLKCREMLAYRKAERYSRAHNFRIYNATRGGKVEAFERVEVDSLFS